MTWTTYREKIKRLSDAIVAAQKPIRILDAIKWDPSIEQQLRRDRFKKLPKIGPDYYRTHNKLGFDPRKKLDELTRLKKEVQRDLGRNDAIGKILSATVEEYRLAVEMLKARGTKRFGQLSRRLYGSPKDSFFGDRNTILSLGQLLYDILGGIDDKLLAADQFPEKLSAKHVVRELNTRFKRYFHTHDIYAVLSDGILADSAAGSDFVKIRGDARFSSRDLDILEVHEGWVHVGTSQNGRAQSVARWLAKGPPRCVATQEGLAVLMEIFTFRSYPRRARTINDRILGIDKAEDGADLLQLMEFYRTEGHSEAEAITNVFRIYRGGLLGGGAPFTKDISYCRGFVENYNFLRTAIRSGVPQVIPFLFAGKLQVDDVPVLYQKYKEGIVDYPRYLPPQFADLNGITVWMSFSSFLNQIDLKRVQQHYDRLFKECL